MHNSSKKFIKYEEVEFNVNDFNIDSLKITNSTKVVTKQVTKRKVNVECNRKPTLDCPICFSDDEEMIDLGCSHSICMVCASRIFYVMNKKNCPVCKRPSDVVPSKLLTILKCQKCPFIAKTTVQLINHYKKHKLVLCTECIENKHEFPSEYTLYTVDMLLKHRSNGLKEENFRGFYGHIPCIFCIKYFYDADTCKRHCRIDHCICTICETLDVRHSYYKDITELNQHLKEVHFVCIFNECNGIVFGYQSALDEHLFKNHNVGNGFINLNNKQKKSTIKVMQPYEIEKLLKTSDKKKIRKPTAVNPPLPLKINYDATIPAVLQRKAPGWIYNSLNPILEFLKKKYPNFHEELFQKSNRYLNKEITPDIYLECVELLLGGKETIQYADVITRYYEGESKNLLVEYLKIYKKKILFPKFESKEQANTVPPKKVERKFGFKILEVKKK